MTASGRRPVFVVVGAVVLVVGATVDPMIAGAKSIGWENGSVKKWERGKMGGWENEVDQRRCSQVEAADYRSY